MENLTAALGEEAREEELVGVTQKQLSVKIYLLQQRHLLQGISEEELRERGRASS